VKGVKTSTSEEIEGESMSDPQRMQVGSLHGPKVPIPMAYGRALMGGYGLWLTVSFS